MIPLVAYRARLVVGGHLALVGPPPLPFFHFPDAHSDTTPALPCARARLNALPNDVAQTHFFGWWLSPRHLLRPSTAHVPRRVRTPQLSSRECILRGRRGRGRRRRGPLCFSPTLDRRDADKPRFWDLSALHPHTPIFSLIPYKKHPSLHIHPRPSILMHVFPLT